MSIVFEGIDMPTACCFVDGEHSVFVHMEYCKFYGICKQRDTVKNNYKPDDCPVKLLEQEPTPKNDLAVDCISRADALRVAKNEYLRGWHNALCKALNEKYSIHCEEGNFSVIQEETITGLGLSMNCALGKDVESYMSTMPSVTPQLSSGLEKNSQKLEKDFGESDCISRADAIRVASGYCHPSNVAKELAKLPSMGRYDPYTDKFIKE